MMTLLAILALAQNEAAAAAKATLDRGSFAFRITPATDLRDALPRDLAAVAGVPVFGERGADGTFRATDGAHEIAGRGDTVLVRVKDGWERESRVVDNLVRDIRNEFGEEWWWQHGNITRAKDRFRSLLALLHLRLRVVPPDALLTRVESDLRDVRKTSGGFHEGRMTVAAARDLLQGPFAGAVADGTLIIDEPAGRGRVWIDGGLVRKVEFRATAKITVVDRRENTRRTQPLTVSITTEFTKIGEAAVKAPDALRRALVATGK